MVTHRDFLELVAFTAAVGDGGRSEVAATVDWCLSKRLLTRPRQAQGVAAIIITKTPVTIPAAS